MSEQHPKIRGDRLLNGEQPTFIHQGGKTKPGRKKATMELSLGIKETEKANEGKERLDELKVNEERKKSDESESVEEVRSLYKREFHPVEYMRQYYAEIDPEEGFFLTELHHFFHQKQLQRSTNVLDLGPKVVLEVGSGPLISGGPNSIKA